MLASELGGDELAADDLDARRLCRERIRHSRTSSPCDRRTRALGHRHCLVVWPHAGPWRHLAVSSGAARLATDRSRGQRRPHRYGRVGAVHRTRDRRKRSLGQRRCLQCVVDAVDLRGGRRCRRVPRDPDRVVPRQARRSHAGKPVLVGDRGGDCGSRRMGSIDRRVRHVPPVLRSPRGIRGAGCGCSRLVPARPVKGRRTSASSLGGRVRVCRADRGRCWQYRPEAAIARAPSRLARADRLPGCHPEAASGRQDGVLVPADRGGGVLGPEATGSYRAHGEARCPDVLSSGDPGTHDRGRPTPGFAEPTISAGPPAQPLSGVGVKAIRIQHRGLSECPSDRLHLRGWLVPELGSFRTRALSRKSASFDSSRFRRHHDGA